MTIESTKQFLSEISSECSESDLQLKRLGEYFEVYVI